MAQQVKVSFVDDLDGGEAAGTVSFALDGRAYEIDLSVQNTERLRAIYAPFVEAGRRTSGVARAPRRAAVPDRERNQREHNQREHNQREHNQAVREWAQAQGMSVSTRGRISSEVLAAYEARDEVAAPPAAEPAERPRRTSKVQQPTFSSAPA